MARTGNYDVAPTTIEIDKLNYTYDSYNVNRLIKVTDLTNSPLGFSDGANNPIEYDYDGHGNMIRDDNKGITSILYNHLNLPTQITFSGGTTRKINYLYSAVGAKHKKVVTDGTVITTTDYLSGFQYQNNVLEFFPHAEGYVKYTEGYFNYVFNYTDHLGNVRLSYAQDPKGGATRIMEENHYYPFGLKHTNYDNGTQRFMRAIDLGDVPVIIAPDIFGSAAYKYKYNGKELQDELGLNFYDYGARNYDAALGRWMNVDPLAEQYYDSSTYNYAINNPVFFIDPNGQEVDVSSLFKSDKKEDRWLLVQLMMSLKDITGMTITTSSDKEGKTTLKGEEDKEITNSSSSASKYVSHLLTMSETITVRSTEGNTGAWPNGVIDLNAAQINGVQKGLEKEGINKNVMSVGMAFLHETLHTKSGASCWKKSKSEGEKINGIFTDYGESPGFVESRLNSFRKELGLPTLYRYTQPSTMYILVKGKKVEVPISNVKIK